MKDSKQLKDKFVNSLALNVVTPSEVPLKRPLDPGELSRFLTEEGRLTVVLSIPFGRLVDLGGIDALNDYVEERALKHGYLCDILYRVVGHVAGTDQEEGHVLVEIDATVEHPI